MRSAHRLPKLLTARPRLYVRIPVLTKHDLPNKKSPSMSAVEKKGSEIEGILEPKRKRASPAEFELTDHATDSTSRTQKKQKKYQVSPSHPLAKEYAELNADSDIELPVESPSPANPVHTGK